MLKRKYVDNQRLTIRFILTTSHLETFLYQVWILNPLPANYNTEQSKVYCSSAHFHKIKCLFKTYIHKQNSVSFF